MTSAQAEGKKCRISGHFFCSLWRNKLLLISFPLSFICVFFMRMRLGSSMSSLILSAVAVWQKFFFFFCFGKKTLSLKTVTSLLKCFFFVEIIIFVGVWCQRERKCHFLETVTHPFQSLRSLPPKIFCQPPDMYFALTVLRLV